VISRVLIALVRGYQKAISPLLGHNCRFTPTCSQYMIQAIQVHGPAKGLLLGLSRACVAEFTFYLACSFASYSLLAAA